MNLATIHSHLHGAYPKVYVSLRASFVYFWVWQGILNGCNFASEIKITKNDKNTHNLFYGVGLYIRSIGTGDSKS